LVGEVRHRRDERFHFGLIVEVYFPRRGGSKVFATVNHFSVMERDGQHMGDVLLNGPDGARRASLGVSGAYQTIEALARLPDPFTQLVSIGVDERHIIGVVHAVPPML
jgi:hypothetical protein